jgi:hypothetical protein
MITEIIGIFTILWLGGRLITIIAMSLIWLERKLRKKGIDLYKSLFPLTYFVQKRVETCDAK